MTKKEKRGLIKEIKEMGRELRRISKKDPTAASIQAEKAAKALTGKVYAGTVIGLAGLLLLILDIASPLGVLAFVIGLPSPGTKADQTQLHSCCSFHARYTWRVIVAFFKTFSEIELILRVSKN